ncbi:MAG: hypothetical protein H6706_00780 [Myxococcales bacterium]|nr:hypothetical protein [Myxococcales bacterium]
MLLIPLILLANVGGPAQCPPLAPLKAAVFPANVDAELAVEGDAEAAGRVLVQRIQDVGGQDVAVASPGPGRLTLKGFVPGGQVGLAPLLVPGHFALRWVDEPATKAALGDAQKAPAELPAAPAGRTWLRQAGEDVAVLVEPASFTEADFSPCAAQLVDDAAGGKALRLALTDAAKARFGEETGRRVNQRLAFIADEQIMMLPVVREAITGGQVQVVQPREGASLRVLLALVRSGPLAPTKLMAVK